MLFACVIGLVGSFLKDEHIEKGSSFKSIAFVLIFNNVCPVVLWVANILWAQTGRLGGHRLEDGSVLQPNCFKCSQKFANDTILISKITINTVLTKAIAECDETPTLYMDAGRTFNYGLVQQTMVKLYHVLSFLNKFGKNKLIRGNSFYQIHFLKIK